MASLHVSDGAPSEVAAEVPFHDLCSLMERVQKVSGLEKKKKIFRSFLEKWREEHLRLHPTDANTTVSFVFFHSQVWVQVCTGTKIWVVYITCTAVCQLAQGQCGYVA